MAKFYITGLYHTKDLNDSTLPPLIVEAEDQVEALCSIGATAWTEEEFQRMRQQSLEDGIRWPDPINVKNR